MQLPLFDFFYLQRFDDFRESFWFAVSTRLFDMRKEIAYLERRSGELERQKGELEVKLEIAQERLLEEQKKHQVRGITSNL